MKPRFLLISLTALALSLSAVRANNMLSEDLASWSLKHPPEAVASMNVETENNEQVLAVEVTSAEGDPKNAADIRISQIFGDVNGEQAYQISFQARANEPGKIVIFIYPDSDSKQVLFRKDINVDMDWRDYSFTFTPKETTSQCTLGFAGLGRANNKYFFRAMSVQN